MVRAIVLTLGGLLLLSGCGIKGPLRPPPPPAPAAVPADAAAQGSPSATPETTDPPAGAKKP
jgi:predicted small lipoprotein YifL